MRHNGRPVVRTSRLEAHRVSLPRGQKRQVVCPDCDCWGFLVRGMLQAHRAADGSSRCPGSGQRFWVDESPERWRARLETLELATEAVRGGLWSGRPLSRRRWP